MYLIFNFYGVTNTCILEKRLGLLKICRKNDKQAHYLIDLTS